MYSWRISKVSRSAGRKNGDQSLFELEFELELEFERRLELLFDFRFEFIFMPMFEFMFISEFELRLPPGAPPCTAAFTVRAICR